MTAATTGRSARYLEAYLTVPQAAELLGVSRQTMAKILDDGEIPYIRPHKHRRVKRADVLAHRQRKTEGGVPGTPAATENLLAD